jgi:hypothetical protein
LGGGLGEIRKLFRSCKTINSRPFPATAANLTYKIAKSMPSKVIGGQNPNVRWRYVPIAKRPIEVITDTTNCQERWRIYDESVACFGPYRTAKGATKPEGFDKCNDILSPEIKCGPRRN